MTTMATTPQSSRPSHPFINHSLESYEAKLRTQAEAKKEDARASSPEALSPSPPPSTATAVAAAVAAAAAPAAAPASTPTPPKLPTPVSMMAAAAPSSVPMAANITTPARSRSHSKSSINSQSDLDSPLSNTRKHYSGGDVSSAEKHDAVSHDAVSYDAAPHDAASQDSSQDSSPDSSFASAGSAGSQSTPVSRSHSQIDRELKDLPRKRRRTSPNELHVLETEFSRNSKPCKEDRERIASLTSMDEKAVQVWFQNKRQSCRRQQSLGTQATPAVVRTHSMPVYQDENSFKVDVHSMNLNSKLFEASAEAPVAQPVSTQPTFSVMQPKTLKCIKLAMSADGKAELVERSPLKQLQTNVQRARGVAAAPLGFSIPPPTNAMRFASMPTFSPQLSGVEQECASSLLFLKSGQWR